MPVTIHMESLPAGAQKSKFSKGGGFAPTGHTVVVPALPLEPATPPKKKKKFPTPTAMEASSMHIDLESYFKDLNEAKDEGWAGAELALKGLKDIALEKDITIMYDKGTPTPEDVSYDQAYDDKTGFMHIPGMGPNYFVDPFVGTIKDKHGQLLSLLFTPVGGKGTVQKKFADPPATFLFKFEGAKIVEYQVLEPGTGVTTIKVNHDAKSQIIGEPLVPEKKFEVGVGYNVPASKSYTSITDQTMYDPQLSENKVLQLIAENIDAQKAKLPHMVTADYVKTFMEETVTFSIQINGFEYGIKLHELKKLLGL